MSCPSVFVQVIGLLGDIEWVCQAAKVARPNVTAFAFLSSSVNPVLYVFAGSSHIRNAGLGFMARLFEGTNSDGQSRSSRTSRSSVADENSAFRKLTMKLTGQTRVGGGGGGGGRIAESVTGAEEEETKKTADLKTLMTVEE